MRAPRASRTSEPRHDRAGIVSLPRIVTLRRIVNLVNLSTPAGLLIARIGGCRVKAGPRRLLLASGYRISFPYAGAFTVGNVLIARGDWDTLGTHDPGLLPHEEGHTWQWMALGPLFLPVYTAAMVWSWVRTGDRSSANWFEIRAGLESGGYRRRELRPIWRRRRPG